MSGLNKDFTEWWNSDELVEDNPFSTDTAMFWAWEGWQAGVKREREACAALNAEMLAALYAVEVWLSSGEGTGFQEKVSAAINKAEGQVQLAGKNNAA